MTRYPRPCPVAAMLIFVCTCTAADAQTWFQTPLSPRTASYVISVSLDPQTKTLKGEEVLTWKNPSNDVIQDLQFHLYLNAFRNNQSTMMREWGKGDRGTLSPGSGKRDGSTSSPCEPPTAKI